MSDNNHKDPSTSDAPLADDGPAIVRQDVNIDPPTRDRISPNTVQEPSVPTHVPQTPWDEEISHPAKPVSAFISPVTPHTPKAPTPQSAVGLDPHIAPLSTAQAQQAPQEAIHAASLSAQPGGVPHDLEEEVHTRVLSHLPDEVTIVARRTKSADAQIIKKRSSGPGWFSRPAKLPTRTTLEAKPDTFLRGMGILALLILFQVCAFPLVSADAHLIPPWKLIQVTGSVTFMAAAFFVLVLVTAIIPMPYIMRSAAMLGIGTLMIAVGMGFMHDAASSFAFRGHPGIDFVFLGKSSVRIMLVMSLWFPAALYWRSRYPYSFYSRIGVVVGALIVATCYLFLLTFAGSVSSPIATLLQTVTDSNSIRGDVLSAVVLLLPIGLVGLSVLAFLPAPRTGATALWGWCYVTALALAPIILAVMVSWFRQGQWKYILAPLQSAFFLYAGLIIFPIALGHVAGEGERLYMLRKLKKTRRS
jgi:hypothetical protein